MTMLVMPLDSPFSLHHLSAVSLTVHIATTSVGQYARDCTFFSIKCIPVLRKDCPADVVRGWVDPWIQSLFLIG